MLQATLAACHARARIATETDWAHIARLYAELGLITSSPVVEPNRAVAVAMAFGAAAGLGSRDGSSRSCHFRATTCCRPFAAICSRRSADFEEARCEFERAVPLIRNARERELLRERGKSVSRGSSRRPAQRDRRIHRVHRR